MLLIQSFARISGMSRTGAASLGGRLISLSVDMHLTRQKPSMVPAWSAVTSWWFLFISQVLCMFVTQGIRVCSFLNPSNLWYSHKLVHEAVMSIVQRSNRALFAYLSGSMHFWCITYNVTALSLSNPIRHHRSHYLYLLIQWAQWKPFWETITELDMASLPWTAFFLVFYSS